MHGLVADEEEQGLLDGALETGILARSTPGGVGRFWGGPTIEEGDGRKISPLSSP